MHAAVLSPIRQFELTDDHEVIGPPMVREQLEDLLGKPRRNGLGDPERALMRAVLLDAVLCLVGQSGSAKERERLAADARTWITSRARTWVFAFENVCDALDFDPTYMRRRLIALTETDSGAASDAATASTRQTRTARAVRSIRKSSQRRRRALHFLRPDHARESA